MKKKSSLLRGTEIMIFLKNLRRLSFEKQVFLGAHALTAVSCFFPWVSFDPLYGPTSLQNAFSGATWLLGGLVFILSGIALAIFLDKLSEKKLILLPVDENVVFGAGSSLSLILLISAWSVLRHVGQGYSETELRFGLSLCLIAQIVTLVSLWIQSHSDKKAEVEDFFQLPTEKKSRQSETNHPKK